MWYLAGLWYENHFRTFERLGISGFIWAKVYEIWEYRLSAKEGAMSASSFAVTDFVRWVNIKKRGSNLINMDGKSRFYRKENKTWDDKQTRI